MKQKIWHEIIDLLVKSKLDYKFNIVKDISKLEKFTLETVYDFNKHKSKRYDHTGLPWQ
jgi:hypothetical protein